MSTSRVITVVATFDDDPDEIELDENIVDALASLPTILAIHEVIIESPRHNHDIPKWTVGCLACLPHFA